MSENKTAILKKIGGALVGIGIFLGFKFYNKYSTKKEIKEKIVALCEQKTDCLGALDRHFEDCFDKNFSIGGRRRASKFNTEAFVNCFNTASGEEYLSYSKEEEN